MHNFTFCFTHTHVSLVNLHVVMAALPTFSTVIDKGQTSEQCLPAGLFYLKSNANQKVEDYLGFGT